MTKDEILKRLKKIKRFDIYPEDADPNEEDCDSGWIIDIEICDDGEYIFTKELDDLIKEIETS